MVFFKLVYSNVAILCIIYVCIYLLYFIFTVVDVCAVCP